MDRTGETIADFRKDNGTAIRQVFARFVTDISGRKEPDAVPRQASSANLTNQFEYLSKVGRD
jgi:hypothetical protein